MKQKVDEVKRLDEILEKAGVEDIEDTRNSILDLFDIVTEITPQTLAHHKEFFRRLHPEIRRCTDDSLESWNVYARREMAENETELSNAMLELLQEEKERRIRLEKYGAPVYTGKDGVKIATIEEVKAYYLDDRFLAIFESVSGVTAEYKRGMKDGEYVYACPLHGDGHDRNPSGHIYAGQGKYHCFGCSQSGDVFQLYADFQQIDFARAIKMLSEEIPEYKKEGKKWRRVQKK